MEHLRHIFRCVVDLRFGEPQDVVAKPHQLELARTIIVKSNFASVIAIAIRLNNEPLLSPKEIGEVGADSNVDLGTRQSMTAAEEQEVSLEVAASAVPSVLLLDGQTEHVRLPDRPTQFPR